MDVRSLLSGFKTLAGRSRFPSGEGDLREALARAREERRLAEETLARVEQEYGEVFEHANGGVVIIDPAAAVVLHVNRQACRLYGRALSEFVGSRAPAEWVAPGEGRPGERRTFAYVHVQDGRELHCEVDASRIVYHGHPAVLTVHRDVAARHRTEQALRRQALLFNTLHDGVLVMEAGFRVIDCNPAAERIFGAPREELLARSRALFTHPAAAGVEDSVLDGVEREGRWTGEIPFLRGDGREGTADVVVVVQREQGECDVLVAVIRDVSEHKAAQEALLRSQQQLLQAQKMEAIGRLSGAIAHDFNNMLTAIKGFSTLLQMDIPREDPSYLHVEEIQKAADHSAGLTRQLLAFSRQQVLQPKILDLADVVGRVQGMLQRLVGEHISLRTRLDTDLGRVFADPGQIEQVLINLVVNARDAMERGGSITVQASNAILHEVHKKRYGFVEPGSYVMLLVEDTGCGMPPEIHQKIFEPFFTTKEQGQGTGMGLSTVYGIVKQSGGYVLVESAVGVGTTFRIYLPRREAEAGSAAAVAPATRVPTGSETVLLVEDEAVVRRLAVKVLTRGGYRVIESADGAEALRRFEESGGAVRLLLTDVVMPGMSGMALAQEVQARDPRVGVLFMSGYTDDAIAHHGVLAPGTFFIEKPFEPAGLLRRVREALDSEGAAAAEPVARDFLWS